MSTIISPSGGGSTSFPYYDAVKDFAAVGDGVTDNRAALQSALTALASTGGHLFIPAGTYMLSRTGSLSLQLVQANFARISGVFGKSILKHNTGMPASSVSLLKLDRCNDLVLEDLVLDGNWGNAATYVLEASADVALPTATINVASTTGFPSSGTVYVYSHLGRQTVTYTGKTTTTFTGCTGGTGTLQRNYHVGLEPEQNGINHTTYTDPQNYAAFQRGGEHITYSRVRFQQVYGDGIWMGNSDTDNDKWSRGTKVLGCTFDMCARNAISVAGGASIGALIDGCRMTNIFSQCVDSEPVNAPCREVVVRACDLGTWWDYEGRNNPPISIVGGAGSGGSSQARTWRVHDNIIRGTTYIERGKDIVFERNHIVQDFKDGGQAGVLVQIDGDDITIRDNFFYSRTSCRDSVNTRIAAASNGAALPQGTINVEDTTGYPSSGTFYINIDGVLKLITYTGKTSTTFTGCTGGSGTLKTEQSVWQLSALTGAPGSSAAIVINNYADGTSMATPAGVRVYDNQIYARNGRCGIYVQAAGGQTTVDGFTAARVSGAATAVNTAATDIAAGSDGFNIPFAEIAVASNGAALPQGTINVDDTTNFAASGTIIVKLSPTNYQTVAYTGKTGTSFTGCTGGTGTITTGMDVSQSYTVNVTDASGFASSGMTYVQTTTRGYQVIFYTGKTGTSLTGCTFGVGRLNTGKDVYQTLVTDSTQSWATDAMIGLRFRMGLATASITQNSTTQLLMRQSDATHRSSWVDGISNYNVAPVVGPYEIYRPTGIVDIAGNSIDCGDEDGRGRGFYGIIADCSSNNLQGMRLRLHNNTIKNANGQAIEITFDGTALYDLLEVTDNVARDDQAVPTTTAAVHYSNTPNANRWIMRGNTTDKNVPAIIAGLTSGTWRVSDGSSQIWAGFGSPNSVVTAPVGSLYMRVDGSAGSTLYVKESGSGNTGWSATASAAPQAPSFVAQCLLAGANIDIANLNTAGATMGNGILQMQKVRCYNSSFDKVIVETTGTAAAGATAIYVGIYKADGTQTASMATATIDAKTDFQAVVGLKVITLTNSISVTPGDDIYVAILPVGTSTAPAIRHCPNGNANLGLTASQGYRSASFSSGLTSLPGSVALSSMSSTGNLKFAALK